MIGREASCRCGQLRLRAQGEPMRVSVCHCLDCQRRSGSVFATQARFPAAQVEITGDTREWSRRGDEGTTSVFSFCPECGSDVFYRTMEDPGVVAVPVGAFADPAFPPPVYSVYETRKHAWVTISGDLDHYD